MIGVYDSGVGGLSVWRELFRIMPDESYLYFADSAFCPYGTKPTDAILKRASVISEFLINEGAELIVVACNTATAAAISHLRSTYSIPFVGMEPAIKPAALTSQSGVVGVLATSNTLKGELYHYTLERFASGVKVVEMVGEGLVEFVEAGIFSGKDVELLLRKYIEPMLDAGADSIVLGCTHYPFLSDVISKIAGPSVTIVNPAPAVALQAQRLIINKTKLLSEPKLQFFSTADTQILQRIVLSLFPTLSQSSSFKSISL